MGPCLPGPPWRSWEWGAHGYRLVRASSATSWGRNTRVWLVIQLLISESGRCQTPVGIIPNQIRMLRGALSRVHPRMGVWRGNNMVTLQPPQLLGGATRYHGSLAMILSSSASRSRSSSLCSCGCGIHGIHTRGKDKAHTHTD